MCIIEKFFRYLHKKELNDNMKKKIFRNVAIVSAIFITTFSIMVIVNYFQVRGTTPLQTEVIETLKEINDQNANNPVLQEQIRQLDLMARKAYFVRMNQLTTGVYILLGMLVIFIICTRLYFAKDKDIPDKEIDPVDEWVIKTKARRYVTMIASGVAAVALLFVVLSAPFMQSGEMGIVGAALDGTNTSETAASGTTSAGDTANGTAAGDATAGPDVEDATAGPAAIGTAVGDATAGTATDVTDATGTSGGDTADGTDTGGDTATETATAETAATGTAANGTASQTTHNAFRGNNNNGISAAKGLPVKWDLKNMTGIAWKQDIPRKGYNSPVINGDKVFFSGADEQVRELFCYDLNTGAKLWSLAAVNIPGSPSNLPETSEDAGLASSSVATDGKRFCAVFAT